MRSKFFSVGGAIVVLSLLLLMSVLSVWAQSATNAAWDSSITYYSPSDNEGHLVICYYGEGSGPPVCADGITLQPHKAGSLYIGTVGGLPDQFAGGAVLFSDVPVIATDVHFAAGGQAGQYGRPLYTGFADADCAPTSYVSTVLYQQFGSTSMLAIQNADSSEITANLKVYAVGSSTPTVDQDYIIPASSSVVLPASDIPGLPTGFTGSAVISGTGDLVVVVQETDDNGRGAKAFEGLPGGADRIYMATMMCEAYSGPENSYYAIQNVGGATTNVTIDFYDTSGTLVTTTPLIPIAAGAKASINPCSYVSSGTAGSAVISSTLAPIIAMGKVGSPTGLATAFVGQSAGHSKVAAPYIRWAANPAAEWRSYVAVMNVGSSNATDIVARYYDANGDLAGSETLASPGDPLPQYIKTNTNASTAGVLDLSGNFGISPYGGAVEIESDQPIVVVVRVSRVVSLGAVTRFAEDYNAVPVP